MKGGKTLVCLVSVFIMCIKFGLVRFGLVRPPPPPPPLFSNWGGSGRRREKRATVKNVHFDHHFLLLYFLTLELERAETYMFFRNIKMFFLKKSKSHIFLPSLDQTISPPPLPEQIFNITLPWNKIWTPLLHLYFAHVWAGAQKENYSKERSL